MIKGNSFATKADLKQLEKKMDRRFVQVDGRFISVDKRFEQMDARFVWFRQEIKIDLEEFRENISREFHDEWNKKIDPMLGELVKHREQEVISAEQNRRTWDLLEKIAVKVGVPVDW